MTKNDENTWLTPDLEPSDTDQIEGVVQPEADSIRIGRFQILEKLGEGAFGAVYRARDPQLDRIVAIKVAKPGALVSEEHIKRFLREARSSAQLRHQHLVPVHESGCDGDTYYIVSGYVSGNTLREELKSGRQYSHEETTELVSVIAEAIHYAHEQGIVHRDLKPANIMIDDNGQPQVMDFGLARRVDDHELQTQDGTRMGTPAYMSPEQARGESRLADARSDVWSLGVILFELLCHRRPFEGSSLEVIRQIVQEAPPNPGKFDRTLSRDLRTICLRALEQDRDRRYQSAKELSHELKRYLAGEPIRARTIGPAERAGRWIKRNPLPTAFLVSLLAGLGASSYFAWQADISAGLAGHRAKTITEKQEELKLANADLESSNDKLKAALSERERALSQLKSRTAENDLQVGLNACQQGYIPKGLLFLLRAWETAPSDDAELNFTIETNLEVWRKMLHLPHWIADDEDSSPRARQLELGSDGKFLATLFPGESFNAKRRGGVVAVRDAESGQRIGPLLIHKQNVIAMRLGTGAERVYTISRQKAQKTNEPANPPAPYSARLHVWDPRSGKPAREVQLLDDSITDAVFDSTGKTVLLLRGPGHPHRATLLNTNTMDSIELEASPEIEALTTAVLTPDGKIVFALCRIASDSRRTTIQRFPSVEPRIWNAETGMLLDASVDWDAAFQTYSISNQPWMFSGSRDSRSPLSCWKDSFGIYKTNYPAIPASGGPMIAMSRSGGMVATANTANPGTVELRLWKRATGKQQGQVLVGTQLVFSSRGDRVFVLIDGIVTAWYLSFSAPVGLLDLEGNQTEMTPQTLQSWVEANTGVSLTESGEAYRLSATEQRRLLRKLRKTYSGMLEKSSRKRTGGM